MYVRPYAMRIWNISLAFRDLYELPGPGKVGIWRIKKKKTFERDEPNSVGIKNLLRKFMHIHIYLDKNVYLYKYTHTYKYRCTLM